MTIKLFIQAITKFLLGIIIIGGILFLSAGSVRFINGWLFIGILGVPMVLVGTVLMIKNPELLKKRLSAKEKQEEQNIVVKLSGLMFLIGFVIAGLGYRYNWYMLPKAIIISGAVIFLIAYILYAEVLRENTYLSRTIEIQDNQKVIDRGLYSIVRHPMYSITIFMFLAIPIVLGSLYSFFIFCVYPFIIVKRIKNEEELLEKELDGYMEYKKKVKYRLIPFIW